MLQGSPFYLSDCVRLVYPWHAPWVAWARGVRGACPCEGAGARILLSHRFVAVIPSLGKASTRDLRDGKGFPSKKGARRDSPTSDPCPQKLSHPLGGMGKRSPRSLPVQSWEVFELDTGKLRRLRLPMPDTIFFATDSSHDRGWMAFAGTSASSTSRSGRLFGYACQMTPARRHGWVCPKIRGKYLGGRYG